MTRFDTLARDCDDDVRRYDKPSQGSMESVSTKDQLYDLYQSVLGIKKYEHQLVFHACQVIGVKHGRAQGWESRKKTFL